MHTAETIASPVTERRGFLKIVAALGGALITTIIGVPALRAALSPVLPHPDVDSVTGAWTRVADDVTQIDLGVPVRVDFVQSVNDAWVQARRLSTV